MKRKSAEFLKLCITVLCVCICLLCAVVRLGEWVRENGANALMFAAGVKLESAENSEAQNASTDLQQEKTAQEDSAIPIDRSTILMDSDGIVPFHSDELPSSITTPNPKKTSFPVEETKIGGGTQIGEIFVKDNSGSGLNLAEEMKKSSAINMKMNGEVEVLIYHTHTSEAYLDSFTGFYYKDYTTRTQNQDMNVVAVGNEIERVLGEAGIGVVHDKTVNDKIYNGSYSRSWDTIQRNLEEYPTIQVTIDIHRDSMAGNDGLRYKPTAQINGRKAAQIMLIAGCDYNNEMDFPNWQDNLHLALQMQKTAQSMYPGLFRPLNFSYCKYNMNATKGSMLAEVGTEVNTISEAKYSGKLLGDIIVETLKNLK